MMIIRWLDERSKIKHLMLKLKTIVANSQEATYDRLDHYLVTVDEL